MPQAVSGFGVSPKNKAYHWEGDHDLKEGPGAFPRPRKYILPKEEKEGVVIGESVSRNEFGISGGVFPSPSGKLLAVYRKDESAVTQFPLLDIDSRTGSLRNIRYQMNGMASEHISLLICDTLGNVRATVTPTEFSE
jgi:dipeptidyl-peptidase-4